jgi:hypothetical protein
LPLAHCALLEQAEQVPPAQYRVRQSELLPHAEPVGFEQLLVEQAPIAQSPESAQNDWFGSLHTPAEHMPVAQSVPVVHALQKLWEQSPLEQSRSSWQ